jgi:hypothetical protein
MSSVSERQSKKTDMAALTISNDSDDAETMTKRKAVANDDHETNNISECLRLMYSVHHDAFVHRQTALKHDF